MRRERRHLRTRRALSKAAVELFAQKGYAATSAGEIANAADYSERTFFRHFARKEDVVFYDLPERLLSLRSDFENPDRDSAWQVVRRAFIKNARTWEESDREFTLARVRLFHSEPALEARYLEICLEWENAVAELIAAENDAAPESDLNSRLIAAAAVGAFRAAFRAWLAQPATPLGDYLATAFDNLETGLIV